MVNGGPSKQAGWQISCLHLSILVRWHQGGSLLLCKQQLSLVCCSSSPPPQHIDKQRYIQASSIAQTTTLQLSFADGAFRVWGPTFFVANFYFYNFSAKLFARLLSL